MDDKKKEKKPVVYEYGGSTVFITSCGDVDDMSDVLQFEWCPICGASPTKDGLFYHDQYGLLH